MSPNSLQFALSLETSEPQSARWVPQVTHLICVRDPQDDSGWVIWSHRVHPGHRYYGQVMEGAREIVAQEPHKGWVIEVWDVTDDGIERDRPLEVLR